jgi:hypothetical protein
MGAGKSVDWMFIVVLAVTVPIRDIRQTVLQSAFETGIGSSSTVTATFFTYSIPRRNNF